jgi:hypothetical protein
MKRCPLFILISDEIIPETHTKGYKRLATLETVLGMIVMLYLEVSRTLASAMRRSLPTFS